MKTNVQNMIEVKILKIWEWAAAAVLTLLVAAHNNLHLLSKGASLAVAVVVVDLEEAFLVDSTSSFDFQ